MNDDLLLLIKQPATREGWVKSVPECLFCQSQVPGAHLDNERQGGTGPRL